LIRSLSSHDWRDYLPGGCASLSEKHAKRPLHPFITLRVALVNVMSPTKFQVDKLSLSWASELVRSLEHHQNKVIENEIPRAFRSFIVSPSLEQAVSLFSDPLRRKKSEIPVADVSADVEDFGMLAAVAQLTNAQLPAIRVGLRTVPLLPPKGSLTSLSANELFSSKSEAILRDLTSTGMNDAVVFRPALLVRRLFFNGLKRFLAIRVAGVRWARSNFEDRTLSFQVETAHFAAGAGSGGGGGGGGRSSPGLPSMQEWTIHTSGTGYSIYYSAQYGIRSKPTYLNGPTTPVQVYLPIGRVVLAANAGPGGKPLWDHSFIDVPSPTPVYYTKAF